MRIGLLGPLPESADEETSAKALERGADFLLAGGVTRVVYLGVDDALDRLVLAWATRIVGGDPTDEAAWSRAADLAIAGAPDAIESFVAAERKRLLLRALVSLPEDTLRTLEAVGGATLLLIHRRVDIEPDDLEEADVLVYGAPLGGADAEQIGGRWFVTPGSIGEHGGVATIDDEDGELVFRAYGPSGDIVSTTRLGA